MKVLIVGGGGREHALAWKASQSSIVAEVFVAPGNAGTAMENKIKNVDIGSEDIQGLVEFALKTGIDLTIIGPEAPLVLGVVDAFTVEGLKCFGPSKLSSQLEGSKTFSKEFLTRHHIPTAAYGSFTDIQAAKKFLQTMDYPLVVKADGLAAGKGVIIAENQAQAMEAIEDMLSANKFGDAGHRVVIEEFLIGEEASFICMVDGKHILPMASSQDHKSAYDGDTGPNTGGMGAYSPAPVVTEEMHEVVLRTIMQPTVDAMYEEGMPYTGFLYAGLMIGKDAKPKVLEFNCRFGDPETQPIMMRMKSDLVGHCLAAMEGKLDLESAVWDERFALGVVMAAAGYPDAYDKGEVISGLNESETMIQGQSESSQLKVFQAGTKLDDTQVLTSGGRVLCVTALSESVKSCQEKAYQRVAEINWSGSWCRTDIGYRAIDKSS